MQLRLLASNLTAADYVSSNAVNQQEKSLRTQAVTTTQTRTNWQLRLELKL